MDPIGGPGALRDRVLRFLGLSWSPLVEDVARSSKVSSRAWCLITSLVSGNKEAEKVVSIGGQFCFEWEEIVNRIAHLLRRTFGESKGGERRVRAVRQ